MTSRINLLAPEVRARRNGMQALRISAVAAAAVAASLFAAHGAASWRIAAVRAERAAQRAAAAEAELAKLAADTAVLAEGLGHLEAAAAGRGRAPDFLARLGAMPWDGGILTEVRLDSAAGRASVAGLARQADFAERLKARLAAASGLPAGEFSIAAPEEREVQGRKVLGFRITREGRP